MVTNKIAPIVVLSLVMLSASFCQAVASSVPWCAPQVAVLTFKELKSGRAAKVEIRSPNATCRLYGAERATGLSLERSMSIEYNGQAIEVPPSCVAAVSFRLDELSLSFDNTGVAIKIYGKSTNGGEKVTIAIYTIDGKALCGRG
jgi:hypothetical protein